MKEEAKNWMEQAEHNLNAAEHSIESKDFDWAIFKAQQAVETALKAIYLHKKNELIKVHDLVFLANKLNTTEEIKKLCAQLNRVYTETRYPTASGIIPAKQFNQQDAKYFIDAATKIIEWLKKQS